MKIPKNSEFAESIKSNASSCSRKSNLINSRAKSLKVSKLAVRDKKNLEEAKNLLMAVSANGNSLDSSHSASFSEKSLKELSLADIMRTIDELTAESDSATECITDCSAQMVSKFDIFWTSPTAILKAIKYCILRRNWENITHLLLLLLQHKDQYVPIVHKLCILISNFNPMVQKLGLQEEFEVLKVKRK